MGEAELTQFKLGVTIPFGLGKSNIEAFKAEYENLLEAKNYRLEKKRSELDISQKLAELSKLISNYKFIDGKEYSAKLQKHIKLIYQKILIIVKQVVHIINFIIYYNILNIY